MVVVGRAQAPPPLEPPPPHGQTPPPHPPAEPPQTAPPSPPPPSQVLTDTWGELSLCSRVSLGVAPNPAPACPAQRLPGTGKFKGCSSPLLACKMYHRAPGHQVLHIGGA